MCTDQPWIEMLNFFFAALNLLGPFFLSLIPVSVVFLYELYVLHVLCILYALSRFICSIYSFLSLRHIVYDNVRIRSYNYGLENLHKEILFE